MKENTESESILHESLQDFQILDKKLETSKIYMILQYNSLEDIKSLMQEVFVYYAGTDLEDIEEKIKSNFTDLYEAGAYPYIVLKTVELDTVGAVMEPLRIFEYQKAHTLMDGTYKEIAYMNTWVSSKEDRGIQYIYKEDI